MTGYSKIRNEENDKDNNNLEVTRYEEIKKMINQLTLEKYQSK